MNIVVLIYAILCSALFDFNHDQKLYVTKNPESINDSIVWNGYNTYYSFFYSLYITDKYDNVCFSSAVFDTDFDNVVQYGTRHYCNGQTPDIMKDFFQKCNKRYSAILTSYGGHQNILIYDSKYNQFELFDSYGALFSKNKVYDNYISKIKKFTSGIFQNSEVFIPEDFFPEESNIQQREEDYSVNKEYTVTAFGFCVSWSLLYLEKRLENPDITRNNIVERIINSGVEHNSKEIRNYTIVIFKFDDYLSESEKQILFVNLNKDFFFTVSKRLSIIVFCAMFVMYALIKCTTKSEHSHKF